MLVINAALPGAEADKKIYRLEPNDEIRVTVRHFDEFTKESIRVDGEGFVNLPLLGLVKAQQMTTSELESALREQLRVYLVDPDVTVVLVKRRSHPVSVIGAVQMPGVHQLDEPKRLIEVLSLAGGVRVDAGSIVNITRRMDQAPLALPNAKLDSSGEFYVGEVALDMLVRAKTPALNIMVQPNDVISVPRVKNRPGSLDYLSADLNESALAFDHDCCVISRRQAVPKLLA